MMIQRRNQVNLHLLSHHASAHIRDSTAQLLCFDCFFFPSSSQFTFIRGHFHIDKTLHRAVLRTRPFIMIYWEYWWDKCPWEFLFVSRNAWWAAGVETIRRLAQRVHSITPHWSWLITCYWHLIFQISQLTENVRDACQLPPQLCKPLGRSQMSGQQSETVLIYPHGHTSTKMSWLWRRIAVSLARFRYFNRC